MESVIGSCAGLDVHKRSVEACVRRIENDGRLHTQTRSWGTTTGQLKQMAEGNRRSAEVLLAEVGTNMKVFPSAQHLASWAGMCPGNDQTAGKRRSGKTTKGSIWLRTALVQAAWGASHSSGATWQHSIGVWQEGVAGSEPW